MLRIVYTSVQAVPFGPEDLESLLARASVLNESVGVTGILLVSQREFLQCIEGPAEAVRQVYRRIQADPRHTDLQILSSGPIRRRQFDRWSMVGLMVPPQQEGVHSAFSLLDHRLDRPWRTLGKAALELIQEYAHIKLAMEAQP